MTMRKQVKEVQRKTILDVTNKLLKNKKCLLIRPTGFGKTKMSVDIAKKFKKAVFLYPFNNIGNTIRSYNMGKLKFQAMTYNAIRNKYNSSFDEFKEEFSEYDNSDSIFIFDEAHFLGAPTTSVVVSSLMKKVCPNAVFLGITATPNRTDKVEIKWHFFDGITAYEYNIKEALNDNIYIKPYYVYTTLDGEQLETQILKDIDNLNVSDSKKNQLKRKVSKLNLKNKNISNLSDIISNNIQHFESEDNYYKFILFFSSFDEIHRKRNYITKAFKKVFPNCTINEIIISSENQKYRLNLNMVHGLSRKENTIDLIFNVNMLTFGSHLDDITGIMMFRNTSSDIIYTQQIGRCLSVVSDQQTIVFDFVENLYNNGKYITQIDAKNLPKYVFSIFTEEQLELDENYKDFVEINRLINNAITEEFESEVINAYKNGLVDMEYCIVKLELVTIEDFNKILRRYI